MSYNYGYYFVSELVLSALALIITVVGFLCFLCYGPDGKTENARCILSKVFPYVKKKKDEGDTCTCECDYCDKKNNGPNVKYRTTIFGYKIDNWNTIVLSIQVALVFGATAMIFAANLLIQHSSSCNAHDKFDCFPNGAAFNQAPNCSKENDQCFKFAWNPFNAAEMATGTFAFSWMTATVFLWIVTKFAKKLDKETKKYPIGSLRKRLFSCELPKSYKCYCCVSFAIGILLCVVLVAAPLYYSYCLIYGTISFTTCIESVIPCLLVATALSVWLSIRCELTWEKNIYNSTKTTKQVDNSTNSNYLNIIKI